MLKKISISFILFAVVSVSVHAQKNSAGAEIPPEYKSDGCTLFPDGNYRDCCVRHDREYFQGGSCRDRRRSDDRLYRCVRSKKGWYNKIVAPVMWIGVRIGGVSFLPTPFRWGFGKSWRKNFQKKKRSEKKKSDRKNRKNRKYQDESRIRFAERNRTPVEETKNH